MGKTLTELKELITQFFDQLKAAIKEYLGKQEAALKVRLKKLLIISISGRCTHGPRNLVGGVSCTVYPHRFPALFGNLHASMASMAHNGRNLSCSCGSTVCGAVSHN